MCACVCACVPICTHYTHTNGISTFQNGKEHMCAILIWVIIKQHIPWLFFSFLQNYWSFLIWHTRVMSFAFHFTLLLYEALTKQYSTIFMLLIGFTMQETQVQSLDGEDPLEGDKAIHASSLAWRIPWTDEPAVYSPWGSQRVGHDWATNTFKIYTFHKTL